MEKKTYHTIGTLRTGEKEDKEGGTQKTVYLALGNTGNKDPKYDRFVEIIVKDRDGKIIHQQENGYISLLDPRTGPYARPNTPDFIRYELKISK